MRFKNFFSEKLEKIPLLELTQYGKVLVFGGLFILVLGCQSESKKPITKTDDLVKAPIQRLSDLEEGNKPREIKVSFSSLPKSKILNFNKPNNEKRSMLPMLRDEQGNPILDQDSNPFFLGEGGVSQFKKYTSDDGLALDGVNSALVDSRGHIWFGTNGGGATRFDGLDFYTYTENQGLASNIVRSMLEDSKGNIWFGTVGRGISKFDGKTFENFGYDKIGDDVIYSMVEDREGNIWFGSSGIGVIRYDGESFSTLDQSDGLAGDVVISMAKDSEGNLWFGTNGDGLSRFDGSTFKTFTTEDGLPSDRIRAIYSDADGSLWIGTLGGGISKYDGKTFQNFNKSDGLAGNVVRSIISDKNGQIWIATETGVSRFDGERFISYTTEQGLAGNSVLDLAKDSQGNLWFCTDGGGVSRLDGLAFTSFTNQQGLAGNLVLSGLQDREGNHWFGTAGWGVSKYDGQSFTTLSSDQGISGDVIHAILEDETDRIWLGTGGDGVSIIEGDVVTIFDSQSGLPSDEILCLTQDRNGSIWMGTYDGVVRWKDETLTLYTTDQGIIGNEVLDIIEDQTGAIWFGAVDGGVTRFDGEKFINFSMDQGLIDNAVLRLTEDELGNIWIGTGHGVSVLFVEDIKTLRESPDHLPNFLSIDTEQGLPDNVILQITDLPGPSISLGTNQGLAIFDFDPKADNPLQNLNIFNSETGYPVKDLTDGENALLLDRDGILWAGTGSVKNGLVRFDLSQNESNQSQPKLLLKQIRLNEEIIPWQSLQNAEKVSPELLATDQLITIKRRLNPSEESNLSRRFKGVSFESVDGFFPIPQKLVLPYRHNQINIEYGTDELSKPDLIEYQYRLNGYESEWGPVLRRTSATFGNIQEGSYKFEVRARIKGPIEDQSGEWTEPISFSFTVLPPWYRSWWAYTIYTILFLSLIYPLHLYQRNRVLKAEREKAKERELAHAREIEKAYKDLESAHENLKSTQSQLIQAEKMASLGELTAGIAHEIQNPLNFVKNFSEVSHELVEEMYEVIESGDFEEAKIIAKDVKENMDRIATHSMRADAIVKAMLQHSKASMGTKEPVDINMVADESIRLSYHGIRAKEKDFKGEYYKELSEKLPQPEVIRQEISRILINMCNNSFYAAQEKAKQSTDPDFIPKVKISTHKVKKGIEIKISDNGTGIPQDIIGKIFQPFFTTKPTGLGTGLGLSLSYDTIKSYQGEISVESQTGENSSTTFTIFLPVKPKKTT